MLSQWQYCMTLDMHLEDGASRSQRRLTLRAGAGSRGTLHLVVADARKRKVKGDKTLGAADVSIARARLAIADKGHFDFVKVPIIRDSKKIGHLNGRITLHLNSRISM